MNWKGMPFYLAKTLFGRGDWRSRYREVRGSDIEALSDRYRSSLLSHACQYVPYYRSLGLADTSLENFPILTKQMLRDSPSLFMRDDLPSDNWSTMTTSGSTGAPLSFLVDPDRAAWFEATMTWYFSEFLSTSRIRKIIGPELSLWGQARGNDGKVPWATRFASWLAPRTRLDPYAALSEDVLLEYGRTINQVKPEFLWAFAGVLYEVSRVALLRNLKLHRPRLIVSSGETLHPFMRSVIEEAFRCPVYNLYGSSETGYVAGECAAGNLHVFTFKCGAELLDASDHPVKPGEVGRLVLTPLHNYVMPLIRYDTADTARAGPRICSCGSTLPCLTEVLGRTVEFFVTEDGRLVSGGTLQKLLISCDWILSNQILQEDIDLVTVLYVVVSGKRASEEDKADIGTQMKRVLGGHMTVTWREVEEIPRTRNGKRPYARSLVWESRQPDDLWPLSSS